MTYNTCRYRRQSAGILDPSSNCDTIRRVSTPIPAVTDSEILRAYAETTPGSGSLHQQAKRLLPDGVTHVGRYMEPHPIYVERAAGSRKWDVDGNEYVDYLGGHGALILGHDHSGVVEAVTTQVRKPAATTERVTPWRSTGANLSSNWFRRPKKYGSRSPGRRQHIWHCVCRARSRARARLSALQGISMAGTIMSAFLRAVLRASSPVSLQTL